MAAGVHGPLRGRRAQELLSPMEPDPPRENGGGVFGPSGRGHVLSLFPSVRRWLGRELIRNRTSKQRVKRRCRTFTRTWPSARSASSWSFKTGAFISSAMFFFCFSFLFDQRCVFFFCRAIAGIHAKANKKGMASTHVAGSDVILAHRHTRTRLCHGKRQN